MNEKKISVIIPIYNVEEYLEECLQSVADQTMDGIQAIMVDDGSLDGSTDIAKEFAKRYDNFKYVRQKNGGLGNARNTGVQYAEGKYIIFLDSDDVVPDYAYEKMYQAAERNQSDMVVGNVSRFNSKKETKSNLHEIAFQKYFDKTHITENLDLLYDTTSWNKLIRKDFWDRYGFSFPEGILYEDIPVTIPMHYLANNVTMVHDVCYRWRIRDGANKSITQRTDDFTNLKDRITVLRMVDKFFEKHVKEDALWEEKHYKWLFTDLMIFVNTCIYLSDDSMRKMMKIIKDYIEEAIPLETIDKLPVIYREKYKCLLDFDTERITKIRQYEVDNFRNIKIVKRNGHYIGKFPKDLIDREHADMSSTLERWKPTQLVERVFWEKEKCIIEGYAFLMGVPVPKPGVQKLQAYLFRTDTGEKIPIHTDGIKSKYANRKFGFKIDNETKQFYFRNYTGAGFRIILDVQKDIIEKNLNGEYHILLTYERDEWKKETMLRGIMRSVRLKLDEKSYLKDHIQIELRSAYRSELNVNIKREIVEVQDSRIDSEHLKVRFSKPVKALYAAKDTHHADEIPAVIQDNEADIKLEDLPTDKRYLAIKDGRRLVPVLCEKKNRTVICDGDIQVLEEIYNNHQYYILRRDNGPVVKKIEQKDSIFHFEIVKRDSMMTDIPDTAKLYVEDPLIGGKIILGESIVTQSNQEWNASFDIDLTNEEIIKNLYAKRRQVFIAYQVGDCVEEFPVRGDQTRYDKKYFTKTRRYRFIVDADNDCLFFTTLKIKGFFTRSKKKRDFTNRFIYPLLRLLSLKKKWIVFESMWGDKYSCNPRYLYEYIDKNHPDYKCIWVLKDECTPIEGNGTRVRRLSFKYLYYMARAKYFVNNVNFADDYVKRKGQIEVQTMHGTPLKTIGLDVPGDFPTKKKENNYIRKCNRWDYLIVQSQFVADLAPTAFRFKKIIMDTGYPRTDILYESNNEKEMSSIKRRLGLPTDKKVIMYAPTWRVRNRFDLMLDLEEMKKKFSDEYILILRLHHFSVKGWEGIPEDGFVYDLTNYQSIEDLYIITDILITDYSSVMFDYAVLDRPMLFFTYDLDDYRHKLRGFNIDIEKEAPGPLLFTSDEVIDAIDNIEETIKKSQDRVRAFNQKYIQYECKNSSEKVFKMMVGE